MGIVEARPKIKMWIWIVAVVSFTLMQVAIYYHIEEPLHILMVLLYVSMFPAVVHVCVMMLLYTIHIIWTK